MNGRRTMLIRAGGLLALFCLFTLAVALVDVRPIGPNGSEVGFAAINGAFARLVGVRMGWYELTEALGLLPLLAVVCFAAVGLWQAIRRKSLWKADVEILWLGVLCVVLAVLYVLFELLAVNLRPVLLEGGAEPSYPSSHTLLFVSVLGAAVIRMRRRMASGGLRVLLQVLLCGVILLGVVGRTLSGVHWLTDIVGSLLLSGALLAAYGAMLTKE